ncbi:hypothetical protein KIPB_001178 [Kipferlia bialata]|uniref:Uncharacterized protein n=1 Tax=Kipferlia bialata TaxID=797122 RepID=A0A9K3GFE3_9EUKA|nr:hypothetical protein KIPB_001178 [Kipferlia bialata]|eukprot:g1178.t1
MDPKPLRDIAASTPSHITSTAHVLFDTSNPIVCPAIQGVFHSLCSTAVMSLLDAVHPPPPRPTHTPIQSPSVDAKGVPKEWTMSQPMPPLPSFSDSETESDTESDTEVEEVGGEGEKERERETGDVEMAQKGAEESDDEVDWDVSEGEGGKGEGVSEAVLTALVAGKSTEQVYKHSGPPPIPTKCQYCKRDCLSTYPRDRRHTLKLGLAQLYERLQELTDDTHRNDAKSEFIADMFPPPTASGASGASDSSVPTLCIDRVCQLLQCSNWVYKDGQDRVRARAKERERERQEEDELILAMRKPDPLPPPTVPPPDGASPALTAVMNVRARNTQPQRETVEEEGDVDMAPTSTQESPAVTSTLSDPNSATTATAKAPATPPLVGLSVAEVECKYAPDPEIEVSQTVLNATVTEEQRRLTQERNQYRKEKARQASLKRMAAAVERRKATLRQQRLAAGVAPTMTVLDGDSDGIEVEVSIPEEEQVLDVETLDVNAGGEGDMAVELASYRRYVSALDSELSKGLIEAESHRFIKKWYCHKDSGELQSDVISVAKEMGCTAALVMEVRDRAVAEAKGEREKEREREAVDETSSVRERERDTMGDQQPGAKRARKGEADVAGPESKRPQKSPSPAEPEGEREVEREIQGATVESVGAVDPVVDVNSEAEAEGDVDMAVEEAVVTTSSDAPIPTSLLESMVSGDITDVPKPVPKTRRVLQPRPVVEAPAVAITAPSSSRPLRPRPPSVPIAARPTETHKTQKAVSPAVSTSTAEKLPPVPEATDTTTTSTDISSTSSTYGTISGTGTNAPPVPVPPALPPFVQPERERERPFVQGVGVTAAVVPSREAPLPGDMPAVSSARQRMISKCTSASSKQTMSQSLHLLDRLVRLYDRRLSAEAIAALKMSLFAKLFASLRHYGDPTKADKTKKQPSLRAMSDCLPLDVVAAKKALQDPELGSWITFLNSHVTPPTEDVEGGASSTSPPVPRLMGASGTRAAGADVLTALSKLGPSPGKQHLAKEAHRHCCDQETGSYSYPREVVGTIFSLSEAEVEQLEGEAIKKVKKRRERERASVGGERERSKRQLKAEAAARIQKHNAERARLIEEGRSKREAEEEMRRQQEEAERVERERAVEAKRARRAALAAEERERIKAADLVEREAKKRAKEEEAKREEREAEERERERRARRDAAAKARLGAKSAAQREEEELERRERERRAKRDAAGHAPKTKLKPKAKSVPVKKKRVTLSHPEESRTESDDDTFEEGSSEYESARSRHDDDIGGETEDGKDGSEAEKSDGHEYAWLTDRALTFAEAEYRFNKEHGDTAGEANLDSDTDAETETETEDSASGSESVDETSDTYSVQSDTEETSDSESDTIEEIQSKVKARARVETDGAPLDPRLSLLEDHPTLDLKGKRRLLRAIDERNRREGVAGKQRDRQKSRDKTQEFIQNNLCHEEEGHLLIPAKSVQTLLGCPNRLVHEAERDIMNSEVFYTRHLEGLPRDYPHSIDTVVEAMLVQEDLIDEMEDNSKRALALQRIFIRKWFVKPGRSPSLYLDNFDIEICLRVQPKVVRDALAGSRDASAREKDWEVSGYTQREREKMEGREPSKKKKKSKSHKKRSK